MEIAYLEYLLIFMVSINIRDVQLGQDLNEYPRFADGCDKNCTLNDHLPCRITTEVGGWGSGASYSYSLWPSAPESFTLDNTYDLLDGQCVARLWFKWIVPNDASGKVVTGFELSVFSLEYDQTNSRVYVNFNLSQAKWTDGDIENKLAYRYSCIIMRPGTRLTAFIYSLPKPNVGAQDKHGILNRIIPLASIVNGTCIESPPTTQPSAPEPSMYPNLKPSDGAAVTVLVKDKNHHARQIQWIQWMGVALGLAGGILVIMLIIVVTRRCRINAIIRANAGSHEPLVQTVSDINITPFSDNNSNPSVIVSEFLLPENHPAVRTSDQGQWPGLYINPADDHEPWCEHFQDPHPLISVDSGCPRSNEGYSSQYHHQPAYKSPVVHGDVEAVGGLQSTLNQLAPSPIRPKFIAPRTTDFDDHSSMVSQMVADLISDSEKASPQKWKPGDTNTL